MMYWSTILSIAGLVVGIIGVAASLGVAVFLYAQGQINMVHHDVRQYFDVARNALISLDNIFFSKDVFREQDQMSWWRARDVKTTIEQVLHPMFFRINSTAAPFTKVDTLEQIAELHGDLICMLIQINSQLTFSEQPHLNRPSDDALIPMLAYHKMATAQTAYPTNPSRPELDQLHERHGFRIGQRSPDALEARVINAINFRNWLNNKVRCVGLIDPF
jgi:hypothetical protein